MADWLKLYDVYVYNKMTIRFHAFTSLVQHMYIWYYNLVWNWIFNWETICRRHHTINSVFIGIANESNAFTAPNIQLITALDQFTTYIHTYMHTYTSYACIVGIEFWWMSLYKCNLCRNIMSLVPSHISWVICFSTITWETENWAINIIIG